MARILVHALAVTSRGGAAYCRRLVSHCSRGLRQHDWLLLLPSGVNIAFPRLGDNVSILHDQPSNDAIRGSYTDHHRVQRLIAEEGIDVIVSPCDFGVLQPPVPQLLVSRNALYFSIEHVRQLRRRCEIKALLNVVMRQKLALSSIRASDQVVVPSNAMRDDILAWNSVLAPDRFHVIRPGLTPPATDPKLSAEIRSSLDTRPCVRRILLPGAYHYGRNVEVMLRAIGLLGTEHSEPIELILTTKLGVGVRNEEQDSTAAARLIQEWGLADHVTMLGKVSRNDLDALCRLADVVVCPSYVESAGTGMIEAMKCGRPIVASDLPIHRETCQGGAIYAPPFHPQSFANAIKTILDDASLGQELGKEGLERAKAFRWSAHFRDLSGILQDMIDEAARSPKVA
ncbi:glycosyltransferase family 4 protein [Kolteria novifilia]|uniref:glycosyltransferase family 4 protein n=1 Tax=Kolteria novifilia TaxID=2527975 RepID=UPI003AF3F5EA